jgi:hypothetical protein
VIRRIVLVAALVVMVLVPLPVLASDTPPQPPQCAARDCRSQPALEELWGVPLVGTWPDGTWSAGTGPGTTGDGGTVPVNGQTASVAVGDGLAVVGTGLSLTGYDSATGHRRWKTTLNAAAGTEIVAVRAWPGVITVGLLAPGGHARTEVVLDAPTGTELRSYPAAVFGGAVTASAATTVVIGRATVTSYDNATGRPRWQRSTSGGQSWQADGQTLYVAQAPGGYLSSSPVTALKVIDLKTGAEQVLSSPLDSPFSGALAMAVDRVVLFASSAGVTAYSGSTGNLLWSRSGWVPEGTDEGVHQADFTLPDGSLVGADPQTGRVRDSAPASVATGTAALYVVRDGVALGLNSGASGTAWGYDMTKGDVTWISPALPWPHFYSDVVDLGGSAAASGDLVVVTACPHLASSGTCAGPELVAFHLDTAAGAAAS